MCERPDAGGFELPGDLQGPRYRPELAPPTEFSGTNLLFGRPSQPPERVHVLQIAAFRDAEQLSAWVRRHDLPHEHYMINASYAGNEYILVEGLYARHDEALQARQNLLHELQQLDGWRPLTWIGPMQDFEDRSVYRVGRRGAVNLGLQSERLAARTAPRAPVERRDVDRRPARAPVVVPTPTPIAAAPSRPPPAAPAVPVAPAAMTNLLVAALRRGNLHLTQFPDDHYATQLVAFNDRQRAERYIFGNRLKVPVYWEEERNGAPWYVVLEGVYRTRADARSALLELPLVMREADPWTRPVRDLKGSVPHVLEAP